MKLSKRIVIAALVIAGSTGAVYAYGKHNHWGMTPEEKVEFVTERVTRKLELDAAQQQNFSQFAGKMAEVMQQIRPSSEQRGEMISELLESPSLDQAKTLELVQTRTRVIDEKAPEVIASLALFLDSLTPEQRQQVQEFALHRHHHHKHDR